MEEALEDFQFNRITHRTASLADRAAMGQFEKPDALAEIQNPEVRAGPQHRRVILASRTQSGLLRRSRHGISGHLAIGPAKGGIRADEIFYSPAGIVSAGPAIALHELDRLQRRHAPFNDRSGKVPGNVGRAGKKVIVTVAAGVGLEHFACGSAYPFMRLHTSVSDDRPLQFQRHWKA